MKIKKEIAKTTILNEENEIEEEITIETDLLFPEENCVLRNKINGTIIKGCVGVGTEDSKDNYEEIPADEGV